MTARRPLRLVGIALAASAIVLFLIGAGWPWIAPRLTYQPRSLAEDQRDPSVFGYDGEQVRFRTPDGETLHAWFLNSPSRNRRGCTVLFAHGNAGNVASHAGFTRPFLESGFDVFLFDYRGYGASSGSPSEAGLYSDALAAFDHVVAHHATGTPILIASHSLGTPVAAYLAAHRQAVGLILAAPFRSLPEAVAFHLAWAPSGLLRWKDAQFDVGSHISRIAAPIMVVAGAEDRLVPPLLSRNVYEDASSPKRWVRVPGGHNQIFGSEQFVDALNAFADDLEGCGYVDAPRTRHE